MNEFELIARLTRTLPSNDSVVVGAGDDCAVLDLGLADPLWDLVDMSSVGLWLVFGLNSTTGAWEATDPWWFLKVP